MKTQGIGVGGIILNAKNEILLLLRNSDSIKADSNLNLEGTFTLPSGKVFFKENFTDAAIRKVKEETNLEIKKENLEIVSLENDFNEEYQYATIGFIAKNYQGDLKLKTPEFVSFSWYSINNLPYNLCLPSKKIIANYLNKRLYLD